jgi:tetratricopeptide (TPR) repeat protein
VLGNVAIQLSLAGELERSLATANASLEIADQLDLDDIRAHALNTIGMVRVLTRDPGGLEQLEQSLAVSLEQNNAENVVRGYKNLGSMLFELGELERLPELYAGASAAAERFGDTFNLRWFSVERVVFDFLGGRWDDALRTLDEFLDWVETGLAHYMEAMARTMRAQIRLARGDIEGALSDAGKSVDFGRSSGEPQILLFALTVYTSALFAAGKVTDARKSADELLAASTESMTSWLCEAAPVLNMLGRGPEYLARFRHLERLSRWETAAFAVLADDFTRAIDVYLDIGARPYEADARLHAARLAAEDDPVAREHAQRALDFYRSVGADFRVREAEQILGISPPRVDLGSQSASS